MSTKLALEVAADLTVATKDALAICRAQRRGSIQRRKARLFLFSVESYREYFTRKALA